MIISRTPYRISLFGGGSDYPKWYQVHGGSVLGFAINRYCYISLRELPPFFEHKNRIVYSKIETVNKVSEIKHPSVRACLSEMAADYGVEIHHDGDLPAKSGLGSSSSFTVGLLNALNAQKGQMATKSWLASEATRIEQEVIGENVGSQDQIWASYGGMNRIDFLQDSSVSVVPVIMSESRRDIFIDSLMLFFTGLSRIASEVARKTIANLEARSEQVSQMVSLVSQAEAILINNKMSLNDIGHLLHDSWMLKRELTDSLSNERVDSIYKAGRDAGALGGKLLGAGEGGFMLFYVEPEKQMEVRRALHNLIEVSFSVDHDGSKISLHEPDGLRK